MDVTNATRDEKLCMIRAFCAGLRAADQKMTQVELAARFLCSPRFISEALTGKKRTDNGARAKANRNSPKRKALAKRRRLIARLVKMIEDKGGRRVPKYGTPKKLAVAVSEQLNLPFVISVSTVIRDLKFMDFVVYIRPLQPFYALDVNTIANRLAFVRRVLEEFGRSEFRRLVFSDEHYVDTNDNSCRFQWAACRADVAPRERKNRFNVPHLQIWAAVGIGWKSELVFVDRPVKNDDDKFVPGRMNAQSYKRRCLVPNMAHWLDANTIFQQDNARCHTAKAVESYLDNKDLDYIKDWPAYSPDLNMIELVWKDLDELLSENAPAKNVAELREQVLKAWRDLPQAKIDAHVLHFENACRAVLAKEGGR